VHDGRERRRRAGVRRGRERQAEVLLLETDHEARREVAPLHARAEDSPHPRRRGAAADGFDERRRLEAGARAEEDALGDGRERRRADDLVHELRHLPLARLAHVRRGAADRGEDGCRAVERVAPAADHDRERPAIAPPSPPETGASSIATSCAAARSASARAARGAMVLVSITSSPGDAPARMPSGAVTTASTSGVSGPRERPPRSRERPPMRNRPPWRPLRSAGPGGRDCDCGP
jgi:hypothetical protein